MESVPVEPPILRPLPKEKLQHNKEERMESLLDIPKKSPNLLPAEKERLCLEKIRKYLSISSSTAYKDYLNLNLFSEASWALGYLEGANKERRRQKDG